MSSQLVVESLVLTMLHTWQDLPLRSGVTLQLISNDDTRHVLQPFEKFLEESLRGLFVASALHKNVEHISDVFHITFRCFSEYLSLHCIGREANAAFFLA